MASKENKTPEESDSKHYKTFMGVRVLWPPECSDDILAGCIEETQRTLEVYEIAKDGNKVIN